MQERTQIARIDTWAQMAAKWKEEWMAPEFILKPTNPQAQNAWPLLAGRFWGPQWQFFSPSNTLVRSNISQIPMAGLSWHLRGVFILLRGKSPLIYDSMAFPLAPPLSDIFHLHTKYLTNAWMTIERADCFLQGEPCWFRWNHGMSPMANFQLGERPSIDSKGYKWGFFRPLVLLSLFSSLCVYSIFLPMNRCNVNYLQWLNGYSRNKSILELFCLF